MQSGSTLRVENSHQSAMVWIAWIFYMLFGATILALSVRSAHYSIFAWMGLVPLLLAIKTLAPRRAMILGALWGLWLRAVLLWLGSEAFSSTELALSITIVTAIPAIYAFAGAYVTRLIGFRPLLLGLAWVAVEFGLRAAGSVNGLLAVTQEHKPMAQAICGLMGYGIVAFIIAFANAAIVSLLSEATIRIPRVGSLFLAPSTGYPYHASQESFRSSMRAYRLADPRAPPASTYRSIFLQ